MCFSKVWISYKLSAPCVSPSSAAARTKLRWRATVSKICNARSDGSQLDLVGIKWDSTHPPCILVGERFGTR